MKGTHTVSYKYHNDESCRAYEDKVQEMHSRSGGAEPLLEHEIRDLEREHRLYTNGRTIHLDNDIETF